MNITSNFLYIPQNTNRFYYFISPIMIDYSYLDLHIYKINIYNQFGTYVFFVLQNFEKVKINILYVCTYMYTYITYKIWYKILVNIYEFFVRMYAK